MTFLTFIVFVTTVWGSSYESPRATPKSTTSTPPNRSRTASLQTLEWKRAEAEKNQPELEREYQFWNQKVQQQYAYEHLALPFKPHCKVPLGLENRNKLWLDLCRWADYPAKPAEPAKTYFSNHFTSSFFASLKNSKNMNFMFCKLKKPQKT